MVVLRLMGLAVLLSRGPTTLLVQSRDPHWKHIAGQVAAADPRPRRLTALVAGAFQMSSRIRRQRTALHRALGKVYISAVCISAPIATYIGTGPLEPVTIHVEQIFQGGLWLASTLVAWACIAGQMALHKPWMMRSYGFTLIFILSRVPDAFVAHSAIVLSDCVSR